MATHQRDRVRDYLRNGGQSDMRTVSLDLNISYNSVRRIFQELVSEGFLTRSAKGVYAFAKAPNSPPVTPSQPSLTSPASRIKDSLNAMRDGLAGEGITAIVDVHEYADGTVDGQIRVPYTREFSTHDTFHVMEEYTRPTNATTDFFLTGIAVTDPKTYESVDRRERGMNQYMTDFREFTPISVAYCYLSAHAIIDNTDHAARGIPAYLFLWVRHNVDGTKPRRDFRKDKP